MIKRKRIKEPIISVERVILGGIIEQLSWCLKRVGFFESSEILSRLDKDASSLEISKVTLSVDECASRKGYKFRDIDETFLSLYEVILLSKDNKDIHFPFLVLNQGMESSKDYPLGEIHLRYDSIIDRDADYEEVVLRKGGM